MSHSVAPPTNVFLIKEQNEVGGENNSVETGSEAVEVGGWRGN